jgi:hypothetical protein
VAVKVEHTDISLPVVVVVQAEAMALQEQAMLVLEALLDPQDHVALNFHHLQVAVEAVEEFSHLHKHRFLILVYLQMEAGQTVVLVDLAVVVAAYLFKVAEMVNTLLDFQQEAAQIKLVLLMPLQIVHHMALQQPAVEVVGVHQVLDGLVLMVPVQKHLELLLVLVANQSNLMETLLPGCQEIQQEFMERPHNGISNI